MSAEKGIALTGVRVLLTLVLYCVGAAALGLALLPAAWLIRYAWPHGLVWICLAVGAGYFLFGLSLMFITGLARFLLRLDLKEGTYPMASFGMLRWYVANALQLLVWSFFGDLMLLTPFASLYYRLMGAKLGLNVQINSKFCADLSLMEIGDNAVIGGHATVIGHSFEQAGLVLKRVKIGRGAIIGMNSIVLSGVVVGEKATVGAGVVVPKNTVIPPGSIYLGK